MQKQKGSGTLAAVASVALVLLVLLAAFVLWQSSRVKLTSNYQAVFLDSGQAYFGKLESLGTPWSPYVVLTEVYYVQSVTNPETKQTNNILVKRGKEWHGPDRMIINTRHLVLVEPVSESSKVAQLINELKK
jgi:hypothetical protein